MEQQGFRVLHVGFLPAKDNQLPRWYAETAANYPRPGYGPVAEGIDEMAELKNGNTAVAIVMSATILAMALLVLAVILK